MLAVSIVCLELSLIKHPQTNHPKKNLPQIPIQSYLGTKRKPYQVCVVSLSLTPVSPSHRALAGWKSVGLSVFHPGGQTYRQESECNLLFQRKVRSTNEVKLLIPGKRERSLPPPANTRMHKHAHLHTPPLQFLIKK